MVLKLVVPERAQTATFAWHSTDPRSDEYSRTEARLSHTTAGVAYAYFFGAVNLLCYALRRATVRSEPTNLYGQSMLTRRRWRACEAMGTGRATYRGWQGCFSQCRSG